MSRPKIYLLPGLGADRRMYEPQLKLFPEAIVIEHLSVIKGESLRQYAGRVAQHIDTSEPFILIGTSLGGMVSMELSRIIQPEKIILIASVKHRKELPLRIRSLKYLGVHRLLNGSFYKRFNGLIVKVLNQKRETSITRIIKEMTRDANPSFIEWAVNAVVNWDGPENYRSDIIHIHGTSDLMFPASQIRNYIPVKKGSHVMNLSMAQEVNRILKEVLQND